MTEPSSSAPDAAPRIEPAGDDAPAIQKTPRAPTATEPTPASVAVALAAALVLMLAFAFFYVGAFHDPTPHHVPIAVIGPPAASAQLNRLPGAPLDARSVPSRGEAIAQIEGREVYGAYDATTGRLYVASAANRATAVALEQTFQLIAAARGAPAVRVTDVKPLPAADPNGTAGFYAVIAWVFGGYIGATLIGLIGNPRDSSRRRAGQRIGALALYSILAGVLSVVILDASFDVLSGHVVALCGVAALTIFAAGAATAGIQALAGPVGTALVILLFVILGNSASGGPFARPLLPGFWRTIGGVLPPGASVDLARSTLFFDGNRIAGPIIVLVVWAVAGTLLALALGGRVMNPADTEAAAAAGAAV